MSANASNLRAWARRLRTQAAPAAVRAGQAVIAEGIAMRAPAALRGSIQIRRIGSNPEFVGGFVVVDHPAARRLEAKTGFVTHTFDADGPKAARAMVAKLGEALR